jgi:hypothetical protein
MFSSDWANILVSLLKRHPALIIVVNGSQRKAAYVQIGDYT